MGISKIASEDMINRMPENVITNILDRLPIQEAVRTSILSRNWRFTWTLLTQLVFDEQFFWYLPSKKQIHLFYKKNLGKVLLQLKGSITKFVLYIPAGERKRKKEYNVMYDDIVEDLNHWILFLSTKGVREFILVNMRDTALKLPNHLFSCLELKHLKLYNCCLHPVPGFHCFPKLLGFDFRLVTFGSCKYGEFLTWCPLLENLIIDQNTRHGEVKLGDIAKLVNLKRLYLSLGKLGDKVFTSSDVLQFVGSIPQLETLELRFGRCKFLAKDGASKRFSANSHRLMTLALEEIDIENHMIAECACDLINGFPNLQTLKMEMPKFFILPREISKVPKAVCSIKGNLQLQYVEFECFMGSEIEVHFIKSLLAYSCFLKKMFIGECPGNHKNRCCTFASELLKLRRASPVAEIHLYD